MNTEELYMNDKIRTQYGLKVSSPVYDGKEQAREMVNILQLYMKFLNPKHRILLQKRYGLGRFREHTLESISKRMKCTREWVRLLEVKAIGELRDLVGLKLNKYLTK